MTERAGQQGGVEQATGPQGVTGKGFEHVQGRTRRTMEGMGKHGHGKQDKNDLLEM